MEEIFGRYGDRAERMIDRFEEADRNADNQLQVQVEFPSSIPYILGFTQIVGGLVCIGAQVALFMFRDPGANNATGLWSGVVMITAGGVAIGAAKKRTRAHAIAFLVMSVLMSLTAAGAIVTASMGVAFHVNNYVSYGGCGLCLPPFANECSSDCTIYIAIYATLLGFGAISGIVGIWSSVLSSRALWSQAVVHPQTTQSPPQLPDPSSVIPLIPYMPAMPFLPQSQALSATQTTQPDQQRPSGAPATIPVEAYAYIPPFLFLGPRNIGNNAQSQPGDNQHNGRPATSNPPASIPNTTEDNPVSTAQPAGDLAASTAGTARNATVSMAQTTGDVAASTVATADNATTSTVDVVEDAFSSSAAPASDDAPRATDDTPAATSSKTQKSTSAMKTPASDTAATG